MYGYPYYSPFHFLGGLLDFVVWVLVIWAIIAFLRSARGNRMKNWHGFMNKSALDILKERYAKGEINKEEFEAKKKDLE